MNLGHILSRHYLLKVNNRSTRTRCEICSKLTNSLNITFLAITLLIVTATKNLYMITKTTVMAKSFVPSSVTSLKIYRASTSMTLW